MRKPLTPITPLLAAVLALSLGSVAQGRAPVSAATLVRHHIGAPSPAAGLRSPAASAHGAGSDPGVQITMPPVGLSIEYPVMVRALGSGACPPPALVAELLRLGSPPLALAGASQDLTAPGGALAPPAGSWETATLYSLPASFWSQLHCLLTAAKDPLAVGINAERGELAWAAQMVAGARSAATNGLEFSLGNEPDRYVLPNYGSLGKRLSFEEDLAAVRIYLHLAANLRQTIGDVPLLGPELAEAKHWRHQLPSVIAQLHVRMVGVHLYAFSACKDPRAATIRGLLSASAANAPRSIGWVVADARGAGLPAILSESNSISCGGIAGVSNSPASAVWAVRFVLSALKTGFREVRFHLSNASYDPFSVGGGQIIRRPLESALAALNRWLPVGASVSTASGASGLVATAVRGAPGGARFILDNEQARARTIVLPVAHAAGGAMLSAARAGLQTLGLHSSGGRLKVRVPGNSVVAVLG